MQLFTVYGMGRSIKPNPQNPSGCGEAIRGSERCGFVITVMRCRVKRVFAARGVGIGVQYPANKGVLRRAGSRLLVMVVGAVMVRCATGSPS